MIKLFHEAPKSIFEEVQKITDGDYALVHLFEEDEEYLELFQTAITKKGREVILDNSIFELEEAFDAKRFTYWIDRLRPTWYIVPDALEDAKKTMSQMAEWNLKYPDMPGKKIGVVQGKTYEQIKNCYVYMDKFADVDMIAISFDYSYYTQSVPHSNKYVSWMLGRVKLLGDLLRDGIINEQKPHHLLGSSLYWEGSFYSQYPWIYSMDTSNPVVFGLKDRSYERTFTWDKPSEKLFTLINTPLEEIDIDLVKENILWFRRTWNG